MKRNKEQKMDNKGFSLVELIVVIAIMAILIGIMAPNMIGYIERTNVSADIQLADTIRTAVKTAMMDPAVLSDAAATTQVNTFQANTIATNLVDLVAPTGGTANAFGKQIASILGEETTASNINATWVGKKIRSKSTTGNKADMTIVVQYEDKDVVVTIKNSNNGAGAEIKVP